MEQAQNVYEFGQFELNPAEHLLLREGTPVPLTGKAFEALVFLIQRQGHLIEKSELIKVIWEDSFVEEGNLAVTVSMLRKALGDDRTEHRYIETVAKRGYRFVADVRAKQASREDIKNPVEAKPELHVPLVAPHPSAAGSSRWHRYASVVVGVAILTLLGWGSVSLLRMVGASRFVHSATSVSDPNTRAIGTRSIAPDLKARQLYLEGRYYWDKRTKEGLRRSIEYFQRATLRDPQYAEAYAGLADSYVLLAAYGMEPTQEAYPNAKEAVLKALQLDESLAEAHAALGMVSFQYEWNWLEAEAEFRRAIELNPNYAVAHMWYAMSLAAAGKHDQSLIEAQRAAQLDPLSLAVNTELGRVYYWNGRYDLAVSTFRHAVDLDPYFARAHTRLGMAYAVKGDFSSAVSEFQEASRLSGADPYLDGLLGYAEAQNGKTAMARNLLAQLTGRSKRDYVPAFSIALICMGLGDREQSFNWLDKAYQDRSEYLIYAKVDPLLNPLRSDPRFDILLTNMNLLPAKAPNLPLQTKLSEKAPLLPSN